MGTKILIIIFGMGFTNYVFRVLPLVALSRVDLSLIIRDWLYFVPVGVLGAMVAQGIFVPEQQLVLTFGNIYLWSAVPCILVAYKTRSLTYTLVIGMASMALLQRISY